MSEEHFGKSFQLIGGSPAHWIIRADTLKSAADLLNAKWMENIVDSAGPLLRGEIPEWYDQFKNLNFPGYMLAGLSIECVLKAHIAHSDPDFVDEHNYKGPKSHNLLELSKSAGVELSDEDLALLDRLSIFVVWAGKYPIPTKQPHGRSHVEGLTFQAPNDGSPNPELQQIDALFENLKDAILRKLSAADQKIAENKTKIAQPVGNGFWVVPK